VTHQHNGLHHFNRVQAAYAAAIGERQADFSGIERAGETLTPIIDLWGLPEWAYNRGEVRGFDHVEQAAVAGAASLVGIVNPVGSNRIVVVDLCAVWAVAASNASVRSLTAAQAAIDMPNAGTALPLDTRWPVQTAQRTIQGSAAAPAGSLLDVIAWAANLYGYGDAVPYILKPGAALSVGHNTVNILIRAKFRWRDRAAFPGELD